MSVTPRRACRMPALLMLALLPGCATFAGEMPLPLLDSPPTPAATAVPTATTFPLPTNSQRYRLSWDGQMEGTATRLLSCTSDSNCSYQTEGNVPGLATLQETSRFTWQADHVHFQRYERNLQFLFFPQQLVIERQTDGSIRTLRKGVERSYAGRDDLVDLMGLELQLRADLQAGRDPLASYAVADVKGITEVSLSRLPDDTLTLAGNTCMTRVYERRDGDRVTTLWLDPAQAWLPVRIVHRDGNETYRMEWLGADRQQ